MTTKSVSRPLEEIPTRRRQRVSLPDQDSLLQHLSPAEQPYVVFELVSGMGQERRHKKVFKGLAHVEVDVFHGTQPQFPALLSALGVIELSKQTVLDELLLLEEFRDASGPEAPSIYSIRVTRPADFSMKVEFDELTHARQLEVGTGYVHHETLSLLPREKKAGLLKGLISKADALEITLRGLDGKRAQKGVLLASD